MQIESPIKIKLTYLHDIILFITMIQYYLTKTDLDESIWYIIPTKNSTWAVQKTLSFSQFFRRDIIKLKIYSNNAFIQYET